MSTILDAVVPLFSLIILGFAAGKRRWIDASGVKALVGFIFNLAMPALLFRLVVTSDVTGLVDLRFLLCHLSAQAAAAVLGVLISRTFFQLTAQQLVIQGFGASFPNTVLLGIPPIAWIVLAMIWFGGTDATVRVVILVSALPIVFAGAAEGIANRDRGLDDMARAYGAGPLRRFLDSGLQQAWTALFPALILALGIAFKVAVMAELLANAGGIGGALADARVQLDIAQALAWVAIAVILLITVEYTLVQPVRGEVERWRHAARPWGVKR